MIVDTTFVIDLMNSDAGAVQKLHHLLREGEILKITTITIFELFTGVVRSVKPGEERNKVLRALEGQLILSLEREAAEKAGEIDGELIKKGERIEISDSLIAGIALTKNEKVITRNTKHFSRISGLKIESY